MHSFINSPLLIGSLTIPHRLIQGPLAGYSCAPFRAIFNQFTPPAYCVSEMCSANDVIHKHQANSRYLYRAPEERILAYQISGTDPQIMAQAAGHLQSIGADLIDLNCGCPKNKIRKKGAGVLYWRILND
jgi:tRNA-dihydrouridine synthase